ncbi:MAG: NAD(P)/FAD-dependent oxidoreductase [Bifidobacteriaceae bacterium]|jgi:pyruvate/2-oxoglutarate dehydrogenase complex dihydrolipoamide dehydrogenase (E3) component|nr:NAD(P)/FAD-dependent oxidoreductase [Bifidobacteriaceae bacterium]
MQVVLPGDAVICATGSHPAPSPIPGADNPIVVDALDVLDRAVTVPKRVVVIGGGMVGTETALHLAENGHQVWVVEMLPQIMSDVAVTDLLSYLERIAKTDLETLTSTTVAAISDTGVEVVTPNGLRRIEADQVIMATGFRSDRSLYDALVEAGQEAYLVGDAVNPGKIMDAFHTAYRLGLTV